MYLFKHYKKQQKFEITNLFALIGYMKALFTFWGRYGDIILPYHELTSILCWPKQLIYGLSNIHCRSDLIIKENDVLARSKEMCMLKIKIKPLFPEALMLILLWHVFFPSTKAILTHCVHAGPLFFWNCEWIFPLLV